MYISLEWHTPLHEYESLSDILSHSHAFSSHTWSFFMRWSNALSHIIMDVVWCISTLNDPHPSMNMSHSQTFSGILMHSHHIHAHGLWDRRMHSQTLSCMSYNVYQPRMTTTPSLNMSHSHAFSVILMHSHAFSCISYSATQPTMTHHPSRNMSHS